MYHESFLDGAVLPIAALQAQKTGFFRLFPDNRNVMSPKMSNNCLTTSYAPRQLLGSNIQICIFESLQNLGLKFELQVGLRRPPSFLHAGNSKCAGKSGQGQGLRQVARLKARCRGWTLAKRGGALSRDTPVFYCSFSGQTRITSRQIAALLPVKTSCQGKGAPAGGRCD